MPDLDNQAIIDIFMISFNWQNAKKKKKEMFPYDEPKENYHKNLQLCSVL